MPLTDAEATFLDAYVHEVYSPALRGPHTDALRELGANQMDLSWLLTAYHRQALADYRSPLGCHHPAPVSVPWVFREDVLVRNQQLREELEHLDEHSCSVSG
jgi:hypothetical protein